MIHIPYQHTNAKGTDYYLHSREVDLRGGRRQRIYYFRRNIASDSMDSLPEGFKVVENDRTGLPVLKKTLH